MIGAAEHPCKRGIERRSIAGQMVDKLKVQVATGSKDERLVALLEIVADPELPVSALNYQRGTARLRGLRRCFRRAVYAGNG